MSYLKIIIKGTTWILIYFLFSSVMIFDVLAFTQLDAIDIAFVMVLILGGIYFLYEYFVLIVRIISFKNMIKASSGKYPAPVEKPQLQNSNGRR